VKILITGSNGQLGQALQDEAPVKVNGAYSIVIPMDKSLLDIGSRNHVNLVLNELKPDVIINAAAYTAVDKAETEKELAALANVTGVENLANWCANNQALLIHISTDFVFDGESARAYQIDSLTNPVSEYGITKRAAEEAITHSNCDSYIVRTAWVYSEAGHNFVKTILRLANTKESFGVVTDQVGTPTYARNLACMIWALADLRPGRKIWHYTDAGVASWYDFAIAITEEALALGMLTKQPVINPIKTADYPTAAQRPAFSVLDKELTWKELSIKPVHWRVALRDMLAALSQQEKI